MNLLASAKDVKVSSPDGSLTVTIGVDGGQAWYQVNRGKELIIGRSELGLTLKDDADLQGNFKLGKTTRSSFDEIWGQPWGEDALVRNHYNELR
ncbi:MAG: glycoside hydrolase family 97 N-terminal domain-containing protein, partial [Muribaculaceae bacterium]|nr:glycoside hydrolase family 97 N-terminal domain-containing protein [Muribaculaceae bacterium]